MTPTRHFEADITDLTDGGLLRLAAAVIDPDDRRTLDGVGLVTRDYLAARLRIIADFVDWADR
ncbi:MAG: hypothetical protein J2P22_04040 [Nocardioides sp.]|nr:hypothetical protein [Nocardioides sp.]